MNTAEVLYENPRSWRQAKNKPITNKNTLSSNYTFSYTSIPVVDLDIWDSRSDNEIINWVCDSVRNRSMLARANWFDIDKEFPRNCRNVWIASSEWFKVNVWDESANWFVSVACYAIEFNKKVQDLLDYFDPMAWPMNIDILMETLRWQNYVASILNANKRFKSKDEFIDYINSQMWNETNINWIDIWWQVSSRWIEIFREASWDMWLYKTFWSNWDTYWVSSEIDEFTMQLTRKVFLDTQVAK